MNKQLTILSFGAGQDSTYILYRIILDAEFRSRYVKGHFIVVMSDTGDEHQHTYSHVEFIRELCEKHGIDFYFLTSDQGFHPKTWPDLLSQMRRNNTIMSMMFPRSCTDNIKIKPFYNFLNVYIGRRFFSQDIENSTRNKKWIKQFVAKNGKIDVILGIAHGEELRVKTSNKTLKKSQLDLFVKFKQKGILWMEKCIKKVYPMIEIGINRQKAQDYIKSTPWPLPYPSNCIHCPFLSKQEILWMYRFIPEEFYEWVVLEKAKIEKSKGREVNYGVKGKKLLTEILDEAIAEFGHWTDEQLEQYKMSHGHCVVSKY